MINCSQLSSIKVSVFGVYKPKYCCHSACKSRLRTWNDKSWNGGTTSKPPSFFKLCIYKTILFHLKIRAGYLIISSFNDLIQFLSSVCDTLNMLNGSYICVHSKTTTLYLNQLCVGMLQHVSIFLFICILWIMMHVYYYYW